MNVSLIKLSHMAAWVYACQRIQNQSLAMCGGFVWDKTPYADNEKYNIW